MKWTYTYMFHPGGSYQPLTESGPPFHSLTLEADSPEEAAAKAKELYPQHIADDKRRCEEAGNEYIRFFGDREPDNILLMRSDAEEPEDDTDIMDVFDILMPTIVRFDTLESAQRVIF